MVLSSLPYIAVCSFEIKIQTKSQVGNQFPSVKVFSNDLYVTAGVPWWVQALQQWEVRQQPVPLRRTGKLLQKFDVVNRVWRGQI
jgi:hypothetical protein